MNRKTFFAALASALLVFSMLGCNAFQTTNHLQSITLQASLINGTVPTGQSGFFTLEGLGGTIQLQAIGNYSSGKTKDLTNEVTYTMIVDPDYNVDIFGNLLPTPPQTAQVSVTGLITAVDPATCTWEDIASSTATSPSWAYVGDYKVTATFEGITSQPAFIPVASSTGIVSSSNPGGLCGPLPTS